MFASTSQLHSIIACTLTDIYSEPTDGMGLNWPARLDYQLNQLPNIILILVIHNAYGCCDVTCKHINILTNFIMFSFFIQLPTQHYKCALYSNNNVKTIFHNNFTDKVTEPSASSSLFFHYERVKTLPYIWTAQRPCYIHKLQVLYYHDYYNCYTALWMLSRTTRMSQYQKKHSHSHLSWSSIIPYLLPPSIIIHGTISVQFTCLTVFLHNLCPSFFGLPLSLAPSTSYSIHVFPKSLSSFHNICPYHRNLFCCSTKIMPSNPIAKETDNGT